MHEGLRVFTIFLKQKLNGKRIQIVFVVPSFGIAGEKSACLEPALAHLPETATQPGPPRPPRLQRKEKSLWAA